MNRDEAVNLLKEIVSACYSFREEGIMLMPPNADDVLSHGYQLHIKASIGEVHLACIQPIVNKYNLAMANEKDKQLLVIYKPIK